MFALSDELALVQSTDFFLPIVDDPFDFGRIAAANAISDIYAMGASPIMALAILGWPKAKLSMEVAAQVMAGGAEICREAGIRIAGGHSIDDAEPKFGLVVSGTVHPKQMLQNSTGREGDLLVLTKPLGVGAVAQGVKKGVVDGALYTEMVSTMVHLNRGAAEAAREVGVNAATDVTGFSLLGHTLEMAEGAGLGADLWLESMPVLSGAKELIAQGIHPGATNRNLAHFNSKIHWAPKLEPNAPQLLADPQTSGGLLLAVSPDRVEALCEALRSRGCLSQAVIGRLVAGQGLRICASR